MPYIQALVAILVVSALSLAGLLLFGAEARRKLVLNLMALAAGVLAADAFLHLIPEAAEAMDPERLGMLLLFGVGIFFALEHWLHMRHESHTHAPDVLGYLNLAGDALHNFIDGVLVAAAFVTSWETGIAVTVAVILHELPQEFGDFGVLIHSGFSRARAIAWNLLSALAAVAGWAVVYGFSRWIDIEAYLPQILAVTAGGFLYISGAGIFPELKEEGGGRLSWQNFFAITIAVAFVFGLLLLEG